MNFWQILLIIIIALVVIKPERLPEISFSLGRLIAHCKIWYRKIIENSRE